MFNKKAIFVLFFFGLFSFFALIYFYFTQRNFTQNQREFLINLDSLDNYNSDITSELLKNALYSYNSHDKIAYEYDVIQKQLKILKKSKILKESSYAHIKDGITIIQEQVDEFLIGVQDFLILNAAIKNSIVFLSRHVENALQLSKKDQLLYIKALKILDSFKDTRKMQDLDYLRKVNYLLSSDSKSEETQDFIKTFNLHSAYLMKKFPDFILVTQKVLNNNIGILIHNTRDDFNSISLYDFKSLDILASIIFTLLILYFFLVIYLFTRYYKAHTSFVKTSSSLQHSLTHDYLTTLYNRNAFEQDIGTLQNPTILLANIDSFKEINDVYGNEFGNKVLVMIAQLLVDYLSSVSKKKIYRVGGDEFAVLFEDANPKDVLKIGKHLEELIAKKNFEVDTIHFNLSVSIAVNHTVPLLENADLALKIIKKDIGKRVIVYHESLAIKEDWQNNIEVINIIKSALQEDRVVPYFQPIVNLKTLKIEKYEALVRIVLPSKEVLSPYMFLEIASKTQYYYQITKCMITKTMKVANEYPEYRFSLNFSMNDIINEEIITLLFELFNTNLEVASRIDIELLETEVMLVDDIRIGEFITKVHSYGSKILIDDFGTGYSNFSYFSSLDVDIIKIDASIVKEITTDARKLHMLKSIHNFTSGMDMSNVAEFVETKEVALLLKEMGIEYAQGYLFSRPLPQPMKTSIVELGYKT